MFVAEGVLPYFEERQVKTLFLFIRKNFSGSEVVFDAFTPLALTMHNWQLAFSKMPARLRWGLKSPRDIEQWGPGIRLLSQWYYFEKYEKRLGASQLMRYFPPLGRSVGIFHYRLCIE